jgi:hypothetical protein
MTTEQLTNSPCGAELQSELRSSVAANNSIEAGCNVHWLFRGSVVDLATGKHGIRWLIARILTEAQAVFPEFSQARRNGLSDGFPGKSLGYRKKCYRARIPSAIHRCFGNLFFFRRPGLLISNRFALTINQHPIGFLDIPRFQNSCRKLNPHSPLD